jgi:hypothetical protein
MKGNEHFRTKKVPFWAGLKTRYLILSVGGRCTVLEQKLYGFGNCNLTVRAHLLSQIRGNTENTDKKEFIGYVQL